MTATPTQPPAHPLKRLSAARDATVRAMYKLPRTTFHPSDTDLQLETASTYNKIARMFHTLKVLGYAEPDPTMPGRSRYFRLTEQGLQYGEKWKDAKDVVIPYNPPIARSRQQKPQVLPESFYLVLKAYSLHPKSSKRDIGKLVALSQGSVQYRLNALVSWGLIAKGKSYSRDWHVTEPGKQALEIYESTKGVAG